MKNIFLLSLILTFGFNTNIKANSDYTTSIDYRKKRLCKTWYVTKASDKREGREERDNSDRALGSTFTFKKDYTFILLDNSRRNPKNMVGTWKETGKNSFSISVEEVSINFEIKKLTKDILYIVGSEERMGDRKMHLTFSSSFVEPVNKKKNTTGEYQNESWDEEVEIEEMEVVEEVAEEAVEMEEINVPKPKMEEEIIYNKEYLTTTWILTGCYLNGRNVTEEYIGTVFIFEDDLSFNQIEFHKSDNNKENGVWNFENNKLKITINNNTKEYTIIKLTDNQLKLREVNSSRYSYYTFKAIH